MSCWIVVENPPDAYSAGSTISGKVVCVFKDKTNIEGIKIKAIGREHTAWKQRGSHIGDNKFLEIERILAKEGSVGPGTIEYPFQIILPNNCSSSFNNKFGRIEYYLKATVDIPWCPELYDNEVPFVVVAPIDLNSVSGLNLNPVQYENEKELCCWCCASGPITLDVYLDKEAFVVGETMRLKIYCLNMSNKNVKDLTIKLKMIIKSIASIPKHRIQRTEQVLTTLSESGVDAKCDRHYDLELLIPTQGALIPNFSNCQLFQQWCILEVTAKLPRLHKNLIMTNKIVLGHKPVVKKPAVDQKRHSLGKRNSVIPPHYPSRPHIRMPMPTVLPTSTSSGMPAPFDMNKCVPISLLNTDVPYFPGQSSKNSIVPYPSGGLGF